MINPARSFDMLFIHRGVKVAYVRQLYELFWKHREMAFEEEVFDWLSISCF